MPRAAKQRGPYHTLATLASKTGYSKEQLRRLCAQGKVDGFKAGRIWLATPDAVHAYGSAVTRDGATHAKEIRS